MCRHRRPVRVVAAFFGDVAAPRFCRCLLTVGIAAPFDDVAAPRIDVSCTNSGSIPCYAYLNTTIPIQKDLPPSLLIDSSVG
jgi:hypothetical protein